MFFFITGTLFQLMVGLGMFFNMVVGGHLIWFKGAYVCASVAFLFGVLMFFNVESPAYLLTVGKEDEAIQTLQKLRSRFIYVLFLM